MVRRTKVTPEVIRRVKEIKEQQPTLSCSKISEILWLSRKNVNISRETVGRILRGEYYVIDGKVVRAIVLSEDMKGPKKIPAEPGQIAMVKQFQRVLEVTLHQVAEMSRENECRNSLKEEN